MRDALEGRVVVVTGASRGIGAGIARRFGAEGARVAVVARSLAPGSGGHLTGSLEETAAAITDDGGEAVSFVADLADPTFDRSALIDRIEVALGPVDVLVNNAAACFYLPIDDVSERRLRVAYEVNVITPYLLTKRVAPGMRERGAGWILNITSGMGDAPADFGETSAQQARSSTYGPSKAALNRLTQSLATELGPAGIAVNALAPERAVATEGATAMMDLPEQWCEPMETMVEAALALATCDPRAENGLVVKSLGYLAARDRTARTLDGRAALT